MALPPPPEAAPDPTAHLRVRVAVLTYRRPDDIAAVLPLIRDQAASAVDEHTEVDVVVVDNDPDGSARPFVTAFASDWPAVAVRYENETTPGISAARNRALRTTSDRDVLVFIDDDERPTAPWLPSLLGTYRRYRSAAVVDDWRARDPIARFEAYLRSAGHLDGAGVAAVAAEAEALAERWRSACVALPDPPPDAMFEHVYAGPHPAVEADRAAYAAYAATLGGER